MSDDLVTRVARAIYDATHAGLRNCYSWDDAWEPHQERHRERYYKEARAAIAAISPDERLIEAASALIADVRRRYPGEELRCEYMRALDAALKGQTNDR